MRIVTLVEDSLSEAQERKGLRAEHGLGFYIETNKNKFLFDVGMSDLYRLNADKLGIDITEATMLILSHGHYDHGGGLSDFLKSTENTGALVYLKENAFGDYFSHRKIGLKYIGLDKELQGSRYGARLVFTGDAFKINEEISIFSIKALKKETSEYRENLPGANIVLKKLNCDAEYVQDDFCHEQNLVIEEDGKFVLMSACSHCGIVNIIDEFAELYGRRPDVVIGGLHLTNPQTLESEPVEVLDRLAKYFMQGSTKYYIGHCTGEKAVDYLKSRMGERLEKLFIGEEINI